MDSPGWLRNKLGIATDQGGFRSCQFNNVVATQYKNGLDQYIPWHTHASEITDPNPLIVSITLNSPGVFCFAPSLDLLYSREFSRDMNYYEYSRDVRGCVALFPGDLMIMCGSFQEHMLQRTLPFSHIKPYILEAFPAVNPDLKKRLEELVAEMPSLRKRKRSVFTFKRTVRRRIRAGKKNR